MIVTVSDFSSKPFMQELFNEKIMKNTVRKHIHIPWPLPYKLFPSTTLNFANNTYNYTISSMFYDWSSNK